MTPGGQTGVWASMIQAGPARFDPARPGPARDAPADHPASCGGFGLPSAADGAGRRPGAPRGMELGNQRENERGRVQKSAGEIEREWSNHERNGQMTKRSNRGARPKGGGRRSRSESPARGPPWRAGRPSDPARGQSAGPRRARGPAIRPAVKRRARSPWAIRPSRNTAAKRPAGGGGQMVK